MIFTKKLIFSLAIVAMALTSCKKDEPADPDTLLKGVTEVNLDTKANAGWNYISLATGKVVGNAPEKESNNKEWFARTDWDIAINGYWVRTNSGDATSVGAKGGAYIYKTKEQAGGGYIYDDSYSFEKITSLASNISFAPDKLRPTITMGGLIQLVWSEVAVFTFGMKQDPETKKWSMKMPPDYMPFPLTLFRSADGKKVYKVQFMGYKNEKNQTGHVKFRYQEIK